MSQLKRFKRRCWAKGKDPKKVLAEKLEQIKPQLREEMYAR